ncbi:Kelch-like protein 10 [Echinococcus granulosus]|uniref:Kelch-like protein n=1 Tax=Echinococcus granulosus TaxID=6210 RepID=W6UMS8_ECHGR|nr:Kelch-like protein [Echinococcus granulosus]EUB62855.1 Kelch-like protein [Echinococcus granulosus]KAH9280511.1 Kelch-like protein 10 [Echinococcus granulosus]
MRRPTSDVRQRDARRSAVMEQNGTRRRNSSVPFNNSRQDKSRLSQDSETDFLCDRAVEFMESGDICSIVTVELAEQSAYFERLLRYHRGRGIIRLPEFLNAGFNSVVEYIRRGFTSITTDNIYDVFIAADYLLVPRLKEECAKYIQELSNDPSTAINLWLNGRLLFWPEIGDMAFQKILENFEIVWPSEDFLQMEADDVESIIKNDSLNCKNELTVFSAVMRWISWNPSRRLDEALKLLWNVRLGMARNSDLEKMKNHELLTTVPDFAQTVLEWPNSIYSLMDRLDETQKLNLTKPRTPHEVLCVFGGWCDGEGPRAAAQIFSPCSNSWTLWTEMGCQTQSPRYEWLNNLRPDDSAAQMGADGAISASRPPGELPEGLYRCEERLIGANEISCLIGEIPRRVYAGCVLVRNRVYLVGGFDGTNALKSTLCYDFELDSGWYEISCMYEKRYYVSVAYASRYIYALGGHNGENQGRLDTAERYNLDENLWQPIASMNRIRSDAAAAELYNRVYVAGGFEGRRYHDSAEYYDADANQWTLISRMHSPRGGISLVAHEGYIYAIGGNDGNTRLRSIERFDPTTGKWEIVGQMNRRKSNLSSAVLGDDIYIIGGWSDEPEAGILSLVERFDTKTRECIEIRPLTFPASATCACTLRNQRLVTKFVNPQPNGNQTTTIFGEDGAPLQRGLTADSNAPGTPTNLRTMSPSEANTNINHDSMSLINISTADTPQLPYNSSSNNLYYEEMQLDSQDSQMDHTNDCLTSDLEENSYPSVTSSASTDSSRCSSPHLSTLLPQSSPYQPLTRGAQECKIVQGCFSLLPAPPPTSNPFNAPPLVDGEARRRKLRSSVRRNLY